MNSFLPLQSVINPSMPFYILSGISLLASATVIFLPETGGENLANTIAEGEDFGKGQSFFHLLFMERRRREKLKSRTNAINLNHVRIDPCLAGGDQNSKASCRVEKKKSR